MDPPSGETQVADELVLDLNTLLASLSLPVTVESPYDLTPSLLLAILESIIRERLPISSAIRESRTVAAKVEAMKIFLGVLEDDVLRADIGLSEIDPRRLAAGEWDELVFVGKTLCWLGDRRGQRHDVSVFETPTPSSSGGSRANISDDTGFPPYDASETTATTLPSVDSVSTSHVPAAAPRCIHEFDLPSFSLDSQSTDEDEWCDCSLHMDRTSVDLDASSDSLPPVRSRPSVRYDGLIRHVKDEIEGFESWKAFMKSQTVAKTPQRAGPQRVLLRNPTRHTSPTQYTLALLNERARLLEEIAKLKVARARE